MPTTPPIPLFFGVQIDAELKKQISSANAYQEQLFFHDASGSYLQEISHHGQLYLGKWLNHTVSPGELALNKTHIHSILAKVVDAFDPDLHPIQLIPIPQALCTHDNNT
jgi:hypothetical protein